MSKCSICKRPTLRAVCYGCSKPRPPSDIERLAVEYVQARETDAEDAIDRYYALRLAALATK